MGVTASLLGIVGRRPSIKQMLCAEATLVKHGDGINAAKILYCKSWQCEICRPKRARQLIAMAIKGRPETFLTLTVSEASGPDPVTRCRNLVKAWRAVRLAIMKKYSLKALPFLAVVEAQKNGEPHLHIICRMPYVPQKWIAQQMERLIGAPICWIEEVKQTRKLANYVAKYCGKNPQRFGTCKRYWQSRDWLLVPKEEKVRRMIGDPIISRSRNSIEEYERAEHCWARIVFWEGKWLHSAYAFGDDGPQRECEFDGCHHPHHRISNVQ